MRCTELLLRNDGERQNLPTSRDAMAIDKCTGSQVSYHHPYKLASNIIRA